MKKRKTSPEKRQAAAPKSAAPELAQSPVPDAAQLSAIGVLNKYRKELMGVAALWIFMFHHWTPIIGNIIPNHPRLIMLITSVKKYGFAGVDVFFFVSGIGLVWAMEKHRLGEFYLRRLKRVYVPFLILWTVIALAKKLSFVRFLQLVSGWTFYAEYIYDVAWFVPAILTLYLIYPLYHLLMKKAGNPVVVTVAALAVWYACSTLLPIRYDMYGFTNRIPVFLVGVMCGRLEKDGKFPKSRLMHLLAIPLLAGGAVAVYLVSAKGTFLVVKSSECFLPTTLLALGLCLAFPFLLDLLRRGKRAAKATDAITVPLRFYGAVSFEFYLMQSVTVDQYKLISVTTNSTLMTNLIILAVLTGTAWLLNTVAHREKKSPGA